MEKSMVRYLRGPTGLLDWPWARSWLEQQRPTSPFDPIPTGFRLIDVHSKSVVHAPPFSTLLKYACLSYVWGNTTTYQATRQNINALGREGSLAPDNVPATIRDAMDRLCIIQDGDQDDGEKQTQINNMGRIYNHAFVTLAAVEGADANAGLRGVSRSLFNTYGGEVFNPCIPEDLLFGKFHRHRTLIMESKWATRGWTYQEAIFSRRLMFFTAFDVYVERESDVGERRSPLANNWFHGRITYRKAVSDYTKRALSKPNDILDAFHGICGYLFDGSHRFGIPLNGFHNAVSWLPAGHESEQRRSQGRHVFPSWSWARVESEQVVFCR